ncbi:predicted protein [Naegleria gruberi]|uniref:Predicted protein n=1 Tax=Naegleria gruberi TaxID=5762 RepID=D2W1J4_NAEGR|nr:uncharacterized protein NAEGRDRAFT_82034 [Naegleria gruberi]EFC37055.1 predicted protein [Naegleria gruberi]|eukprot:XP_002669799.1 predicted protein [Naegleria gruberi strain NEG-M]
MNSDNFFFEESLLQELSNNLMESFDQAAYSACSSSDTCSSTNTDDESILQFFNFNNQLMTSISCQCEGGFELNNNTKVSRPRGAPFSIYVNDKLNVTISTQFLSENNLNQSSVTISLKTFLFEDVSSLDSLEEYTINLNQAKMVNNQLQITIPIRRDNTTRRKTRKSTAKSIKGEETAEDLERKKKMRRSLNQEATKKVSYIQVIANQQVLATSQNMWCRSKTRSEMEKKKGRKTSTPKKNPSTKRKSSDLIPLEIDAQMINTHLKSAKRVKQTAPTVVVETQPISMVEEEIPEYMMQMIPTNWQEVCGVTTVDGAKQVQTVTVNNDEDDVFALFDNDFMFQEPMPSPSSAIPSMGINLDLDDLFPLESIQQPASAINGHMMFAKPVCLDDLDFDTFLTEQEINM